MEQSTQTPATEKRVGPSATARKLAREWLHEWGDNINARNETQAEFADLYQRSKSEGLPISPGEIDDPSAALMKHCTVHLAIEALCPGRSGVRYLAEHIWVKKEPLSTYRESLIENALRKYGKSDHAIFKWLEGVREAIVEEVAAAIEDSYARVKSRLPAA